MIRYICISVAALLSIAFVSSCSSDEVQENPVRIIFDTDMGNDIDDAMALDMLHKYQDMGKVDLMAVMLNKEGYEAAAYVRLMNEFYGYPEIPIGIIHDQIRYECPAVPYTQKTIESYEGKILAEDEYKAMPEAHILYRKLLADAEDESVVIASVGFSTNLVRLLQTEPDEYSPMNGRELVEKKVKRLCMMAGDFREDRHPEYNVKCDIPSAQNIFHTWPTELVTSPFEVGIQICYPAESIEKDFNYVPFHPMAVGYGHFAAMPYDRPTWDLTTVLYAVEGDRWFTVSPMGDIRVTDDGLTYLDESESGLRRYLSVTPEQATGVLDRFIELITLKPAKYENE